MYGFYIVLVTMIMSVPLIAQSARASDIHDAVARGDLAQVQALLERDPAQLEAKNEDGATPLIVAVINDDPVLAGFLLERGADTEARDGYERTAFVQLARTKGSVEMAKLLFEHGADINVQQFGGKTALIWSALGNNHDLVAWLLAQGAETELRDDYQRTALLLVARETGDAAMAKLLLENGAEVDARDKYGATPLELAAWRGFREVVDLTLDAEATIPDGDRDVAALTMFATEKGLGRLFGILAERGADLNITNQTGGTLLHSAAEGGAMEIVELLLAREFDIEQRDTYGWRPLHYAAKKGRTDAVRVLIESGAAIEPKTVAGYTPLSLAVEFERDESAALLRARGAVIAEQDFPRLSGSYLGQSPPGDETQVFALDIVASNRFEHGTVSFSPVGKEAFWASSYMLGDGTGYSYGRILTSRLEDGYWTTPRMADFSGIKRGDDVPFIAPDGKRLYFLSRRPHEPGGEPTGEMIWYVDRTADDWSEPRPIEGGPSTMSTHWQFSVAANGNIYFNSGDPGGYGRGDLYVSRLVDGSYQTPENLGDVVNSEHEEFSPFIAPDESYLIITKMGQPDSLGGADLYISFRSLDGNWMTPLNMGGTVNSRAMDICPQVTRDGRYLMLNSSRAGEDSNFWVDAQIIEKLRANSLK